MIGLLQSAVMGDTVSIPTDSELKHVHAVDASLLPLGHNHGAPISTDTQVKVILKEKLFSWSGDNFKIKYDDGVTFGSNLQMQSKVFSMRDRMVLINGVTQEVVCVALSMFTVGFKQIFHIYVTAPVFHGQERSSQQHNSQALYTYATVEREYCSTEQSVHLTKNDERFAYTIHRAGSYYPKTRTVRKDGSTCAVMAGGDWGHVRNSYKITVNPGIDACLMIMICAICDEMDENQKK